MFQPVHFTDVPVVAKAGILAADGNEPLPGSFLGDPVRAYTCSLPQIQKSRSRVSGSLLDRLYIQVEVRTVAYRDLAERGGGESWSVWPNSLW